METMMRRAIVLAKQAKAEGGSPFGALIAEPGGRVVVEGRNHASQNSIWHGEMDAINSLADQLKKSNTTIYAAAPSLELYTTAEPCSMCMSAIAWSGFGRVIFGSSIAHLESSGINQINVSAAEILDNTAFQHILLVGGVLESECDKLYTPTPSTGPTRLRGKA
jgi:tRNA(Arg) A34 adenosine deaminase TadA